MDVLDGCFRGHPSQKAVAELLLAAGIRVTDGRARCGDIELTDAAIARAAGTDRRAVRSALEKISSVPELDAVFSKAKCTLSMADMAPAIGCSSLVIVPTDAKMPGILAEVAAVLYGHGISVRQAMVDDAGDEGRAVLSVVAYGRIPSEVIPELKACRGVDGVLIKRF